MQLPLSSLTGKFHQTLTRQVLRRLRALVLVPTRELVVQVYEVFRDLCKNMNLRVRARWALILLPCI
jgi:superfamily II DNA/RNA helicase